MAFPSKPDRSKLNRSPIAPKKSPCQVVPRQEGGGFSRKCSSPVFTSSPMRPPVRRGLPLPVPKTPDHQHHKENGPPCKVPPSPASSSKQFVRAVAAAAKPASPKKILGEHNVVDTVVVASKKCRKEWEIPISSAIELKESLSGMESPADAGCAVDQGATFPVNVEVLGEPEPVVGWVQERVTTHREVADSKELARNLFGGAETPGEQQSPQHSSSGSSSHGTVTGEVEDDLAVVSSMILGKVELDGIGHATEEDLAAVTLKESNVAAVMVEATETISDVRGGTQTISRSIKWTWALGSLALVLFISALAAPQRQILDELWRRRSDFSVVVPGEIEWSSEADTVGLYVDPAKLLEHWSVAKCQLLELYEKTSGKVVEGLSLSSVRIITAYYSSLVLGNHAKDVLFNYCREFQGQYYRLRVATVSLIEQAIPLESAAREVLKRWSSKDGFSKARQWLTRVESYANEALVHRYLRLPLPSHCVEEAAHPYFEPNEEADGNNHVAETGPVVESDEFSNASDWIGDAISVCRLPEHRSRVNTASTPKKAKQDTTNESDMELETPNADENNMEKHHHNNSNLYLGAVLVVAVLGLAVSYRLPSAAKVAQVNPPVEEFSSPACVLSAQDIMRMRGADEELILTPEQETGGYSPYGSFTAYKRVVYNEGSEKEEVKLTPVRRSSRIRNQVPRSTTS